MKNYKVAIVGAGPAGYFTAQALQAAQTGSRSFSIDIIERLPTPWGLVRSGVAPDHQKIKTVSKVFEKIATESGFRLFANIEVGVDVLLKDLKDQYDVVVLATGAPAGRKLGIKGESLENVISSANLFSWYNSHPEFTNVELDLSSETAVIIGAGNVALDIARLLLLDPNELETTDIAEYALTKLKESRIRQVIVCGRRAPEHATFTPLELRDLIKLKSTDIYIDKLQIDQSISRLNQIGQVDKDMKKNVEIMSTITEESKKGLSQLLEIKFLISPKEIIGSEKVSEIEFIVNAVEDGKIVATNKTLSIKTGLVITAIGYDAVQTTGLKVKEGRIVNIAGHIQHNLYVTGWAKRGSNGALGTAKSDATDVVDLIIKNLKEPKEKEGITCLLNSSHQIIDQTGWRKIDAHEIISGELAGKPRIKESNWARLINLGTS